MKIIDKILLLVLFLLVVLGANTFMGLKQIGHIQKEFSDMVSDDIKLMEQAQAIEQNQLSRAVLLQKLFSIAEELGFEKVSDTRRQYLVDQAGLIQKGLDHYARQIRYDIAQSRDTLNLVLEDAKDNQTRSDLHKTFARLHHIESMGKSYTDVIAQMTTSIMSGGFQLSLEDLTVIQRQDKTISDDVKALLKDVQGFVYSALQRSEFWQSQAQHFLWTLLILSIFVSMLLAWGIIRSIARPLRNLSEAASQVGKGQFALHLDTSSQNEIAQVAQAFNIMSRQLEEFKQELERKNAELSANLEFVSQQKKDLEKANAEIDRFIYAVTHDILGPLTAIIGYAAFLEKYYGGAMDAKGQEALNGLRKGVVRLNDLIKSLLDVIKTNRPLDR